MEVLPEGGMGLEAQELGGASGVKRVARVFVDGQDGMGSSKRVGLLRVESGSEAVVSGGVGIEERVWRRIECGSVPVTVRGVHGGIVAVFHVYYVSLLGRR